MAREKKPEALWYALSVETGKEEEVKKEISRRCKIQDEDGIKKILIPKILTKELRDGREVLRAEKKFPGYLILQMEFSHTVFFLVSGTRGADYLLPAHNPTNPQALRSEEAVHLLLSEKQEKKKAKESKAPPEVVPIGVQVRVKYGAMKNLTGNVTAVKDGKEPTVTVNITLFGRPVPTTLKHWEVERVR